MTTKIITSRDMAESNWKWAVTMPEGFAVQRLNVGAFGWSAVLRKAGGIAVEIFNGEPSGVLRQGEVLWRGFRHWQDRRNRRTNWTAQAAYWDHAHGVSVRLEAR